MADISRDAFIERVNEIVAENPTYRLGGSGTDGTCDCIGLTIGAIRCAGGAWTGTHGSNYAARYEMQALRRVTVADLYVGMQLYKAREKGQAGYDLPIRYARHADQLDYYHAGVVTNVSPLQIKHVTSGGGVSGPVIDTKIGKWAYGGPLKKVTYDGLAQESDTKEDSKMAVEYVATVTAASGSTVKLRAKASAAERLYWEVPVGAQVKVLERQAPDGWRYCEFGGQKGYMQSQYLADDENMPGGSPAGTDGQLAAMGAQIRAILDRYKV